MLMLVAVKSNWVYSKIENEFQSITGYQIDLGKSASVRGVFPKLTVSFPTVVIKSIDGAGSINRIRLTNAETSLQFPSIGGNILRDVALDVESMTAIVDTDAIPEHIPRNKAYSAENLQERVQAILPYLSDANLDAQIRELVVITRSVGQSASTYKLLDNQLELISDRFALQGFAVGAQNLNHAYEIEASIPNRRNNINGSFKAGINMQDEDRQISLDGTYKISNDSVDIQQITIAGSDLDISGNVNAKTQKRSIETKWKLNASFNVNQLELSREWFSWDSSARNKEHKAPLFSNTRLDLFELLDLDLKLTLGAVRFNNQPIISGDFVATALDNELTLHSDQLVLLGGAASIEVSAVPVEDKHKVSVNTYINDAQLSRLQITNDKRLLFRKGEADAKVSIKAFGNSAASLARSLKGYFMLASHNVEISQRYARDLDRGVVSVVADNIDRFRKKTKSDNDIPIEKGSLPVKCASVKLIINDGYLEAINGLVAELPDNTLLSSGYIDLHSEKIGFAFRTRKKKILDWSALSLIRFVELGGTLTQPRIMLDRKELMKQGLLTTTSVLVGARPPLVYQLAETGLDSLNAVECLPQLSNL